MSLDQEIYYNELVELHESYRLGEATISDEEFDKKCNFFEQTFGVKFDILLLKSKFEFCILPFFMPSVNKAKGTEANKVINQFLLKFIPSYILIDKLDGTSLGY